MSRSFKQVIECMEEGNKRKQLRFAALIKKCHNNGFRARWDPAEVGCREFTSSSICRAYNLLGIRGKSRQK